MTIFNPIKSFTPPDSLAGLIIDFKVHHSRQNQLREKLKNDQGKAQDDKKKQEPALNFHV
jgi:hypothetical protein